ncbi:MAG: hypothetical protein KF716_27700 [Anaerolineae bacterium]|nr:hypothetical protein [Anaerolineae bacterium]
MILSWLCLERMAFLGEHIMVDDKREFNDILPKFSGPVQPLLSGMFHTQPADSWRDLKKPLSALLVLRK